jgi:hypothetical protein
MFSTSGIEFSVLRVFCMLVVVVLSLYSLYTYLTVCKLTRRCSSSHTVRLSYECRTYRKSVVSQRSRASCVLGACSTHNLKIFPRLYYYNMLLDLPNPRQNMAWVLLDGKSGRERTISYRIYYVVAMCTVCTSRPGNDSVFGLWKATGR